LQYFFAINPGDRRPKPAQRPVVCPRLRVYNVYHKSGDILWRLLGLNLSTRVIEEKIAEDAVDIETYYAQKPAPTPQEEMAKMPPTVSMRPTYAGEMVACCAFT